MIFTNCLPNRASAGKQNVVRSYSVGVRSFLPAPTQNSETLAPRRRACDVGEVTGGVTAGLPFARRHDSMIV